MPESTDKTHFGFTQVPVAEKAQRVAAIFANVAPKYDLMNDFMSFGLHRLWKRIVIEQAGIRPGQTVLDVAAGTGDLAKAFAKRVGPKGKVIVSDINAAMLEVGRERLVDSGCIANVEFVQADAENLPFETNQFACVTIAFGLRNVTHKAKALASMYRVLQPGGKLLILEFSHPESTWLQKLYDSYSFNIIPKLGEVIANDRSSYQYLVESIRMHPKQAELKSMMETVGFEDVSYTNLSGGIVAIHKGYKF
jgi:demethylmenaquinone methyltransferase/2-methoxy-6-polyprenyl-1,4-benzoquinol methylase